MNCSELEERKTEEITRLFYEIINYFIVWLKSIEKQLIAIKLAKMVEVVRESNLWSNSEMTLWKLNQYYETDGVLKA